MYICLDYGDRYIGVAATDADGSIPYRYGTIDQKTQDGIAEAVRIIRAEQATRVLVGVPLNLEGEETEQTHKTFAFMETLREALGKDVEVEGVDETLSSVEARRMLEFEGGSSEDEHAEAARMMLSHYLSSV